MNYKLSKLFFEREINNTIVLEAHATGEKIELFEDAFLSEYRDIKLNKGTNTISTELEKALHSRNILVDENFDDESYIDGRIKFTEDNLFSLIILPTEQCNLRCSYCYEDFKNKDLSDEHYDLLLKEIESQILNDNKTIIHIGWFGGEPTLKLDKVLWFNNKIIELTNNNNAEFSSHITTNGTLLNQENFARMIDARIDNFQVTIDGHHHDEQRAFADGSGSFDIIYNNIENMLKTDYEFTLMIRVNVASSEFKPEFYELFNEFKHDERVGFRINPVFSSNGVEIQSIKENRAGALSQREYIKEAGFPLIEERNTKLLKDSCYATCKSSFVVRADGTLAKCTVALYNPLNAVGYLCEKNNKIEVDEKMHEAWVAKRVDAKCRSCDKFASCYNRGCPLSFVNNKDRKHYCEEIVNHA